MARRRVSAGLVVGGRDHESHNTLGARAARAQVIRRFMLWFCQKQFDGAMKRGDVVDLLRWQKKIEKLGGW